MLRFVRLPDGPECWTLLLGQLSKGKPEAWLYFEDFEVYDSK
jgi:hypothetical protein